MTNEQQSREAFEKWYVTQHEVHPHLGYFNLTDKGKYIYYELRLSWEAWQAALATRDTVAAMSEDEEKNGK